MRRTGWWLAGIGVLAVATAAWMAGAHDDQAEGDGLTASAADPNVPATAASAAEDFSGMTPEQIRGRLFEQGALSGTEAVGNWCVQGTALQPCLALRERFDYFIQAVGDDAPDRLRAIIADEARKAHGDKLAADIMQIWEKYWRLRNHAWHLKLDPADTRSWMPAFEEQRQVRRQVLGEAWAQAFFDFDEKQFLAYHEQITTGRLAPDRPAPPLPAAQPEQPPQTPPQQPQQPPQQQPE